MNLTVPSDVKRILVIKWSAMGDVALASAAIEDLARAFPQAEIDLSTAPPWDRLYGTDPRLSHVFSIDLRGRAQLRAGWVWLKVVSGRRYDMVVDLQTTDRSRIMLVLLWLSGRQIPHRVGNKCAFPYNFCGSASHPVRHAMHIIRDALASLGIQAKASRPVLHCSQERREAMAELLHSAGVKRNAYAVFLPGSQAAGYLKRWGASRFATLASLLKQRGIEHTLILGGPDEIEECARIDATTPADVINLCGQTELLDLVPLCESARLVVGNDTGTAHVGSASTTPMVIVCGPTDPRRVLPAGDNVQALQARLACINCYKKHCQHHTCMAWITPPMVVQKLDQMGVLSV
jgi:lipopolysaccharide heptosyltransferase II